MTTDTFNGTGDWNNGSDWTDGAPPGAFVPVEDAALGGGASVTITDTEHARSVDAGSGVPSITIASGGMLLLGGGTSPGDGVFDLESGTLTLQGTLGSSSGTAAILDLHGIPIDAEGGTLNNVTVMGTLDLSAPLATAGVPEPGKHLISVGGLSVISSDGSPGFIRMVGYSQNNLQVPGVTVEFASTETLSNVSIEWGGADSQTGGPGSTLVVDAGSVLTLAHSNLINAFTYGDANATGDNGLAILGNGKFILDADSAILSPPDSTGAVIGTSIMIATAGGFENDGVVDCGYNVNRSSADITSAITGSGSIVLDGVPGFFAPNPQVLVDLHSTVAAGQTIVFGGVNADNILLLDAVNGSDPDAVKADITGLVATGTGFNEIVLSSLAYDATMTGTVHDGVLTIRDGDTIDAIFQTPDLADGSIVLISQSNDYGGTQIEVEAPCYCRGTTIATDRGAVAVEDLRIGDLLFTYKGVLRPIRWIGTRSFNARFAAGNRDVQPVLFKAGCLADGVPVRDLFVSPRHAMYLDGVLIPAAELVNGTTIRQIRATERIEYFHLELETHDVILAEGAPCETFVDDFSRGMFHNVAEFHSLYPTEPRQGRTGRYCAPRVEDGFELEAVRNRLALRAELCDAGRGRIAGLGRHV